MLAGPEVPICILLPSPTSVCVSRLFGAEQTHETPQGKACGMLLRPPKNTHATAKRYRDWVCATVSDTALQLNLCNAPMISEACIGSLPDQVASLEPVFAVCVSLGTSQRRRRPLQLTCHAVGRALGALPRRASFAATRRAAAQLVGDEKASKWFNNDIRNFSLARSSWI